MELQIGMNFGLPHNNFFYLLFIFNKWFKYNNELEINDQFSFPLFFSVFQVWH